MRRELCFFLVWGVASGCAAPRERPAAAPSTMPAESAPASSGVLAPAAPATTSPATEEEQDKAVAPPPPPTGPAATSAPMGGAPAKKTPSAAPVAPGADVGGSAGKPPSIGAAQSAFDDARKRFIAAADCIHLCKALASMTNATDHLCQLTQGGPEHKRCTDAKTKLGAAEAKVKATCGGCD